MSVTYYFQIARVRGSSLNDCALLVHRSPWSDFGDVEDMDWCVMRRDALGLRVVARGSRRASDLWLSPRGDLYVIGALDDQPAGLFAGVATAGRYDWSRVNEVGGARATPIEGVWGLNDDLIFAWGGNPFDYGDDENLPNVTWVKSSGQWRMIGSPARIHAVHGPSADAIFAVGLDGMVAHWDAGVWRQLQSPIAISLSFVHAVSANEAYACTFGGVVLEGTVYGWREAARGPRGILGMGKWRDRVLLAHPHEGLLSLENDRVVPYRAELCGYSLTVENDDLLWVSQSGVVHTRDLHTFEKLPDSDIERLIEAQHFPD